MTREIKCTGICKWNTPEIDPLKQCDDESLMCPTCNIAMPLCSIYNHDMKHRCICCGMTKIIS